VKVHIQQRRVLLEFLLILFPDPDHLAEDLHVEALSLCLGEDVLLVLGECLDLLLDLLNALYESSELITCNAIWSAASPPRLRSCTAARRLWPGCFGEQCESAERSLKATCRDPRTCRIDKNAEAAQTLAVNIAALLNVSGPGPAGQR
jgi:hypothetical protein